MTSNGIQDTCESSWASTLDTGGLDMGGLDTDGFDMGDLDVGELDVRDLDVSVAAVTFDADLSLKIQILVRACRKLSIGPKVDLLRPLRRVSVHEER